MSRTTRYVLILLVAGVVIALVAGAFLIGKSHQTKAVPQGNDVTSDSRLQDLINSRRSEHWDFWETQLALTAPPRSQPVQMIPEWAPAGAVVLALDEEYTRSLTLNKLLGTTTKRTLLANSDEANKYLTPVVCSTLTGAYDSAPTEVELAELRADYSSLCTASTTNSSNIPAAKIGEPKDKLLVAEWLKAGILTRELMLAHNLLKIVSDISQYTKVLILVPMPIPTRALHVNEDALHTNTELIKEFPNGRELLNNKNVQFLQLPLTTKWVRDYGPTFIEGADKHLFVVDSRYNPERRSLQDRRQDALFSQLVKQMSKNDATNGNDESAETSVTEESGRLYDDVSPSILAMYLRQKNGEALSPNPINEVRPPIELDGGDFATDGSGIGFTSTQTLLENGGNLELLTQVFREYFGLTDLVYLQSLPGSTVKHIDMFFKVVSSDTILLGTFENAEPEPADEKVRALQTEAQRVLTYDLEILKTFYESRGVKINLLKFEDGELKRSDGNQKVVNIVLVPMPNVERPVRQQVSQIEKAYAEIRPQLEKLAAAYQKLKESGRNPESYHPSAAELDAVNKYNKLVIAQQGLDIRYPQGVDIYRTYLNALHLNTTQGNVVLIPSYSNHDGLENRVQNIFRKVYVGAYREVSIIKVESDNLIELQGSIHCLTQTIPAAISIFPDEWNYRAGIAK